MHLPSKKQEILNLLATDYI